MFVSGSSGIGHGSQAHKCMRRTRKRCSFAKPFKYLGAVAFQQGMALRRLGGICKVEKTIIVVERCRKVVVFVIDKWATYAKQRLEDGAIDGAELAAAAKGLGSQQSK